MTDHGNRKNFRIYQSWPDRLHLSIIEKSKLERTTSPGPGKTRECSTVKIYLFADNKEYAVPDSIVIEFYNGGNWMPVKLKEQKPGKIIANTVNSFEIEKINALKIRINFIHQSKQVALCELECY